MTNKMHLLFCISFSLLRGSAQIYDLPLHDQSIFKKVTHVKVFDFKKQRYGLIFYYPSESYKSTVNAAMAGEAYSQCKSQISVYKFKHDRNVYDNYTLKIVESVSLHPEDRKVLSDSIIIEVYANSYTRKWNFWRFRYNKYFAGVIKMYSGYCKIRRGFVSTADSNFYTFQDVQVRLTKDDNLFYYREDFDLNDFNTLHLPKLNFQLDEMIAAHLKLQNGITEFRTDNIPGNGNAYYFYTFLDL